jgi:hypothetical protein
MTELTRLWIDAGVVDTSYQQWVRISPSARIKFTSCINNTADQFIAVFVDTRDAFWAVNSEKFEMALMGLLEAWRKQIYEKPEVENF